MELKEKQTPQRPQEERRSAPRRGRPTEDKTPAQKRRAAAAAHRARRDGRQTDAIYGSGEQLFRESLLPMVEHVHRIDQTSLRVGVIWLLILPALLIVIRRLTGSSKVAFLIIWIVGMFIISAALILIAYADHELKRFLEGAKQYAPTASDAELDELLSELESEAGSNLERLAEIRAILRDALERRRAGRAESAESAEETARVRRIEEWLQRLEQRRGKEESDAEHSQDHSN